MRAITIDSTPHFIFEWTKGKNGKYSHRGLIRSSIDLDFAEDRVELDPGSLQLRARASPVCGSCLPYHRFGQPNECR